METTHEPLSSSIKGTWIGEDGTKVIATVQNRVYTCLLSHSINLKYVAISLACMGAQFNRKRFAAVIIRSRRPKIAILLFEIGKMVCTGAKNVDQARFMIFKCIRNLRKIGYTNIDIVNGLHIQNLVASASLPWEMDLPSISNQYTACCSYEPELFPGAILRFTDIAPRTMLLFRSGKMVVTGAKCLAQVIETIAYIVPLIKSFSITGKGVNGIGRLPSKPRREIPLINRHIRLEMGGLNKTKEKVVDQITDSVTKCEMSKERKLDRENGKMEVDEKETLVELEEEVLIQHMPNFRSRWQ